MIAYALILGALIVRTNPLAFMMLTLAAGEMISHSVMLEGLRDYTGGPDGLVASFKTRSWAWERQISRAPRASGRWLGGRLGSRD